MSLDEHRLSLEELFTRLERQEARLLEQQAEIATLQAHRGRRVLSRFGGRRLPLAAVAAVSALVLTTGAFAGVPLKIPDPNGVVHGCYSKSTGSLRVTDSSCRKGEKALNWNQRGPKGQKGDPGTAASAWGLKGNAGTGSSAFLGTTDNQPLIVKTNNKEALRIDPAGNVGVGILPGGAKLIGLASGSGTALWGSSTSGNGVEGSSNGGTGVRGQSNTSTAVMGGSDSGTGVHGDSSSGTGVEASSATGTGVQASSNGRAPGVMASSATGDGVHGNSNGTNPGSQGVVGTLGNTPCGNVTAVEGCGGMMASGVEGASSYVSPFVGAIVASGEGGANIFVGYGGGARQVRFDPAGKGYFNGGTQSSGADYAESMHARGKGLAPGDVLAVDSQHGSVSRAHHPNSSVVVGVYSTKPSVLAVGSHRIGDSMKGEVPVALMGVVPTKVTAQNGPIKPGDLLTTSSKAGYAMKARPVMVHGIALYRPGTLLGKALGSLTHGTGVIQVLLMTR